MDDLIKDDFTGKNEGPLYPNKPLRYLTASSIIGDKVHDKNNAEMGKIEDIMLDLVAAKIDYVIVELGGFLGINVKLFAIPFRMLEVDPANKRFIFKGDKEMIKNAPGFDMEHWPDTNFHKEDDYWHFM